MAKRSLTKSGFIMLGIPVAILCVFPRLAMLPYKLDDPVMISTLPFAIQLVSFSQLFIFIDTMMIDYLSATERVARPIWRLWCSLRCRFPSPCF